MPRRARWRSDRGRGRGARRVRTRRSECSRLGRTRWPAGRARSLPPAPGRRAPDAAPARAAMRPCGWRVRLRPRSPPRRGGGARLPATARHLVRHGEPCPTVAHQPARLELVDQPVRLVMEFAPSVEVGPQPWVRHCLRPRARAAGGWWSAARWGAVTEGEAHCADFPRAGR